MPERRTPIITREYYRFRAEHPRISQHGSVAGIALVAALASAGTGEIIAGDPYAIARPVVEAFDHSCPRTPNALDRINNVLNDPHNRNTGGEGPSPNYNPIAFANKLGLHLEASDQAIRTLNRQTTVQGALDAINGYTGPKHHFKFTIPTKLSLVGRASESLGRDVDYYKPGEVSLAELRKDGDALLDNLSETPTELSALSGVSKIAIVKTLGGTKEGEAVTRATPATPLVPYEYYCSLRVTTSLKSSLTNVRTRFSVETATTEASIKEYETVDGHSIHYTHKDDNSKLKPRDPYTSDYGKKDKGENEAEGQAGITDNINQPPIDHSDATRAQAKAQLVILDSMDGGRGVGQYYAYKNADNTQPMP